MLLTFSFWLIIQASLWSPYRKNFAEPRYDQKDDHFAKYWHMLLNLRFHLIFWCPLSNRHFGTLFLKFLLNPITKETMTKLQNTVKHLGIIVFRKCFAADHQSKILELLLWNSRRNPIVAQNTANLQNTVTGLLLTVFCRSICVYYVSNILQSLLWNVFLTKLRLIRWPVWKITTHKTHTTQITTHKTASLENIVTRLRIIVSWYSYSAYIQIDTLELLPRHCHLIPLWRKRWPICQIFSHASKSSYSFSYLVLIVWATLLSC